MDFVGPPDWDVVARHIGYAAMVLSTLFVVLAILDRMLDRFRHFFDLPGVIRDAYRWRTRKPCVPTPAVGAPDEIETPAGVRNLGDDRDGVPSPQRIDDGVKVIDRRYMNVSTVDVGFAVPWIVYEALGRERARLGLSSVPDVAAAMIGRFVADLHDDPEAVFLPRRRTAPKRTAGTMITLRLGDGDFRLLDLYREQIDWPVGLERELLTEIVKLKLAQLKAARRAAVREIDLATTSVSTRADIQTQGTQQ